MQEFDLVVIGAGVAGLTAAMVAGRYGLHTAVVERMGAGGQIANAEKIETMPGFPEGIAGIELGPLLQEQAERAGAEFVLDEVVALEADGEARVVRCADTVLRAAAVVIAAGSTPRALGVPGERALIGRGVSHCASCDGPFFKGREVGVVGGGDSAFDEALVLAGHAVRVFVFHRGPEPRAQRVLQARAAAEGAIEIVPNSEVTEILGESEVTGVRLRDAGNGAERVQPLAGLFVYVGQVPATGFLGDAVVTDPGGHIETDVMLQTSMPGVFAAGDIRKHFAGQLAAAAGDGATAAIAAFRYLRTRGG